MAITRSENLFDAEILSDMVSAVLPHRTIFKDMVKTDTRMIGSKGDTVKIPYFKFVGEADEYEEGEEIASSNLTSGVRQYKVSKVAKDIDITDEGLKYFDNPQGEIVKQLTNSLALKRDARILDAALRSSQVADLSSAQISYNNIVNATTKFNEELQQEKVMFIAPEQFATIAQDPNFISRTKYGGDVMMSGEIGMIYGIRIVRSRQIKKEGGTTGAKGTVKFSVSGKATNNGKILVDGETLVEYVAGDAVNDIATQLATALGNYDSDHTFKATDNVIEASQKVAGVGQVFEDIKTTGGIKVNSWVETEGSRKLSACYRCPIIQLTYDDQTQNNLAPVTLYPWSSPIVEHFRRPKSQKHEFTVSESYVAALTDDTKVVVACFGA